MRLQPDHDVKRPDKRPETTASRGDEGVGGAAQHRIVGSAVPRLDIPGSLWLPDTGYGELAPVMLDYFRRGLDRALDGRQRPLVFYCLKDCWMSWNAAKRALAQGYSNVAWYPGGSDGWAAAGLPVEKRTPEPRP